MPDTGTIDRLRGSRRARYAIFSLVATACLMMLAGIQGFLFYGVYAPRVARANATYFDLMIERAQGTLYRGVDSNLRSLAELASENDDETNSVASARDAFDDHFASAPLEAIETLQAEMPVFAAGIKDAGDELKRLADDLDRMREIYSDPYRDLMNELDRPQLWLWPMATILATRSGYRDAVTLNRALYLAQIGEIGTARVLLTGLHAATEDPETLGLVYYGLGRLQFELFRQRPEAEYYLQSVQYLRQSLQTDAGAPLTQRLFDYLLSLSQAATAPQTGEGRPTTPSEGTGAAISADQRKF